MSKQLKQPLELLSPNDVPRFASPNQSKLHETISKDGKLIKNTDINTFIVNSSPRSFQATNAVDV